MIVRIRGVKKARSKNRVYYYHRKSGNRIRAAYGTPAFAEEVRQLDAGIQPIPLAERTARKKVEGTLGALLAAYKCSPEWAQLAPRSRSDYQRVFDWLASLDSYPLFQFDPPMVLKIRDKAFAQKKRKFANYVVSVLRLVFSWGVPRGHLKLNPALGLRSIPRPKDMPEANRPWTPRECDVVLSEAQGGLRVAIALGMFAALRIDMARTIRWNALSDDGTTLTWRQKNGIANMLPVHSELRRILDETPRVATTIVASEQGKPYRGGLAKAFETLRDRLLLEGKIGLGLTFHGLRHTAGATLADLGTDPRTIAAMLGDKSLAMAIHYSEGADRRQRASAAVSSLERARAAKQSALARPANEAL